MEIKVLKSGMLQTNTYVISMGKNCIIIDPAFAEKQIAEYVSRNDLRVLAVLLTHGHFDHIGCTNEIAKKYDCKICLSQRELDMVRDADLNGSKKYLRKNIILDEQYLSFFGKEMPIKIDEFYIDILFTPGHSKGSCCYLLGNKLFSGDTLFRNGVGRVDEYGGSEKSLEMSLEHLFSLDDSVEVFPGHGEKTYIGNEKEWYTFKKKYYYTE